MIIIEPNERLPGEPVAYALKPGAGQLYLLAGQVIRTLVTDRETKNGMGVVICTTPHDPMAVPLHYHEREHDTWLCLQGAVQVWGNGASRVLRPGDFAYVQPGHVHSYRGLAEGSEFFGLVTPGDWINFFPDAGEEWGSLSYPAPGTHPLNFPRLMGAMGKYKIILDREAQYWPAEESDADLALKPEYGSYFLRYRHGTRHALAGHLGISHATGVQTKNTFAMRLIEAAAGAAMPAHHHENAHEVIYVTAGSVDLTLAGEIVRLYPGWAASIPAGTVHATRAIDPRSSWIASYSDPRADLDFERCGQATGQFMLPDELRDFADFGALGNGADIVWDDAR